MLPLASRSDYGASFNISEARTCGSTRQHPYTNSLASFPREQRRSVMENSSIVIRGAREHNLRNVNLELPRNRLIVFTGVSGSGQELAGLRHPLRRGPAALRRIAVQLRPAVPRPAAQTRCRLPGRPVARHQHSAEDGRPQSALDRRHHHRDLRLSCACCSPASARAIARKCGRPITAQTREQIIARILALPEGTRFLVLAPVIRGQKGEYKDLFEDMLKRGFVRARVDGQVVRLTDDLKLDRRIKHDIEIVIDRLKNEPKVRPRLAEAVEQALGLERRVVDCRGRRRVRECRVASSESKTRRSDSGLGSSDSATRRHSPLALITPARIATAATKPPTPQLFSFNSPHGMCPDCDGLGTRYTFDPDLLIPDPIQELLRRGDPPGRPAARHGPLAQAHLRRRRRSA